MKEEGATGEAGTESFQSGELAKAIDRLKGRHLRGYPAKDEALRRLLTFAQTDVSTFSAGDWLNWQHELLAFALWGEPVSENPQEVLPNRGISIPILPSKAVIEGLQTLVRQSFIDIIDNGRTQFKPNRVDIEVRVLGPLEIKLRKAKEHRVIKRVIRTYISRSPDAAFQHALSALLEHTADRLHRCEECTRIFLANRVDQVFCSKSCQNRTTKRRWRESHPKRYGKRAQSRKQGRASSKKGGSRHGTKRRH